MRPINKPYHFRSGANAGYIDVPADEQVVIVPSLYNGGVTYLQIRAGYKDIRWHLRTAVHTTVYSRFAVNLPITKVDR